MFEVVKVQWWMQHYSAPTPKRHYGYSNSAVSLALDKGPIEERSTEAQGTTNSHAVVYFDKKGVKRYKKVLQPSDHENLDFFWKFHFVNGIPELNSKHAIRKTHFEHGNSKHAIRNMATSKPRIYPWPFARALIDMVEEMKETASGCPQLPDTVPSAFEMFNRSWDTPADLCSMSDLMDCSNICGETAS